MRGESVDQYCNALDEMIQVQVLENFSKEVEELGPHIHHIDRSSKTIYSEYMEYIESDSLENTKFMEG